MPYPYILLYYINNDTFLCRVCTYDACSVGIFDIIITGSVGILLFWDSSIILTLTYRILCIILINIHCSEVMQYT